MKYRVNVNLADQTKAEFSGMIDGRDARLLNRVGAFASLFQLDLRGYTEPVLVMKTEEPGSKQVLAFAYDRVESVCFDMINHLINDCIVMGAEPLAIQDLIVCGKLEPAIAKRIVSGCSEAAAAQGCVLCGGETSEQPGVLADGRYILGSSIVGLVERSRIIDGSRIEVGDQVIALASSGPHTNGYTLIRDLLQKSPELAEERAGKKTFIEAVLEPHRCYYQSLKDLFPQDGITGMAHITGGGVRDNLKRILPDEVDADIDLGAIQIPDVFRLIRRDSKAADAEMLRAFNLGVGLIVVCRAEHASTIMGHVESKGEQANVIGTIVPGSGEVKTHGTLNFGD